MHIHKKLFPCAAALMASACVSIDNLPIANDAGAAVHPGVAGSPACESDECDSGQELPPPCQGDCIVDPPEPPACDECIPIELEPGCATFSSGDTYEGIDAVCVGGQTCVDDECQDMTTCAPGVAGDCGFALEGPTGPFLTRAADGDFYFVDFGSFDARSNYVPGSGKIWVMRPGEWLRRAVVTGLDLYNDDARTLVPVSLTVTDDYFLIQAAAQPSLIAKNVSALAVPRAAPDTPAVGLRNDYYCFRDGHAYRSDEAGIADRDLANPDPLSETIVFANEITNSRWGGPCWIVDDRLILESGHSYLFGEDASLTPSSDEIAGTVLYADAAQVLTRLADGWIARAVREGDGSLGTHRSLAGPGDYVGIDDAFVYWQRGGENSFTARTRLDGSGEQEVISAVVEDNPHKSWVGADSRGALAWKFGREQQNFWYYLNRREFVQP